MKDELVANSTLTDPVGRTITLHDSTRFGHILKRHPEIARHRRLVEDAVERAAESRISTYDPDCRTCYGAGPRSGIMIAVVIDVAAGAIKTAFFTLE